MRNRITGEMAAIESFTAGTKQWDQSGISNALRSRGGLIPNEG